MIDSVLKGTGNSRFLKSAVPAGTSWADALAMLQAGTFPIDFNGINTEGFQQVGTPLNKANLLKDATAAQIGLPPSTTPDGMFQALGNTGELHVWRKTVTRDDAVDASYTVDDVTVDRRYTGDQTLPNPALICWANNQSTITAASGFTLNPTTNEITLTNPTKYAYDGNTWGSENELKGKYVYLTYTDTYGPAYLDKTLLYYIPSDATISWLNSWILCDKLKYVNVTPYTPAGTTTTYHVSTNPKAYQEGDDAKAAGYVVGEVVSGSFILGQVNASEQSVLYTSSDPSVSDDGTIDFDKSHFIQIGYATNWTVTTLQEAIRGKFLQREKIQALPSSYLPASTTYIPNDAVVTRSGDNYIVSKYQPVTGYAAIPAGTTIEYLGKLGDKARVQVLSYIGTGTYGSSNPCSITADFKIKVAIYLKSEDWYQSSSKWVEIADDLKTQYQQQHGFVYGRVANAWGKRSGDSKTITWYNTYSNSAQLNASGVKYTFLIIG